MLEQIRRWRGENGNRDLKWILVVRQTLCVVLPARPPVKTARVPA